MYYVNLYQTTQCYGGPEEGGWYYEEGVYHSCMGAYSSQEEAQKKADRLRIRKLAFRDFAAMVQEHPGENYPQYQPHYE